MWLTDIMMGIMMLLFIIGLATFMVFVFDHEILDGYFKQKLRNRFKVEHEER